MWLKKKDAASRPIGVLYVYKALGFCLVGGFVSIVILQRRHAGHRPGRRKNLAVCISSSTTNQTTPKPYSAVTFHPAVVCEEEPLNQHIPLPADTRHAKMTDAAIARGAMFDGRIPNSLPF